MKKLLLILLLTVIALIIISYQYTKYYDGPKSDHFDGNRFFDPHNSRNSSFLDFLKWQFTRDRRANWPQEISEPAQYDKPPVKVNGTELRISNVGHVTFLIQTAGLNILTDPVWSERASPVDFAGPKRNLKPGIKFEDLPKIDIVLVSHNHYDHLDLATLKRLWQEHDPVIITPLGNDTIIKTISPDIKVEAYDWGGAHIVNDTVRIYLEPMQHWSARGLLDRNRALWAAFTVQTPGGNIYFVGDSGYGNGKYFKDAKKKFGSFRAAMIPIGAYKPRWFMKYAHMNPDDAMQAYIDLGRPMMIPAHYDVFKLTDEPHGQALQDLAEAKLKYKTGNNVTVLNVGEHVEVPLQ